MSRRMNDGDKIGLKQDKFRNSMFEFEEDKDSSFHFGGVSRATTNTINGPWAENRGRKSADSRRSQWSGSPFEDQKIYNWNNRAMREGDYRSDYTSGNRGYGGGQAFHDAGNFHGRGPRGYQRPDSSIFDDVCETLKQAPDIDASEIEVAVEKGIVSLKGVVPDRETKKLAEYEIENISGVSDVQNKLSFQRPQKESLQ